MPLEKITRRDFLGMFASTVVSATSYLHAKRECGDLEWLTEKSTYIVEGVVERQTSGWDPNIKIKGSEIGIVSWYNAWRGFYTRNYVKIDKYIKGQPRESDTITILNDGTNHGNEGYRNGEETYLEQGKKYRLFVRESGGNFFVPCHNGIEELK